jgi:hypothetical protein
MRKVLIQDSLEEPRAIALNPIEGWVCKGGLICSIFWIQ